MLGQLFLAQSNSRANLIKFVKSWCCYRKARVCTSDYEVRHDFVVLEDTTVEELDDSFLHLKMLTR